MKKAITILAVLIVLVGAVFADDPVNPEIHSVKIKSTVGQVLPIFKMDYNVTTSQSNFTAIAGTTNNGNPGNEWSVSSYEATSAEQVSDISLYNVTGVFTAKVTSDVKLKATDSQQYVLNWKAEPLTQKTDIKEGVAAYKVSPTAAASSLAPATGTTGAADVKEITGDTVALDDTTGDLTGTTNVDFGVRNNKAGNLATFSVVYNADANAPAADYEATISLSITVQ